MIDAQTRRSVEAMCQCGLDFEAIKGCFPTISEEDLREVFDSVKSVRGDLGDEDVTISCNCS